MAEEKEKTKTYLVLKDDSPLFGCDYPSHANLALNILSTLDPDHNWTTKVETISKSKPLGSAVDFESFLIGETEVGFLDGLIHVEFPWKPDKKTRSRIKQELNFKWNKKYPNHWTTQHDEETATPIFKEALSNIIKLAKPDTEGLTNETN